jgi:hypothetical protein
MPWAVKGDAREWMAGEWGCDGSRGGGVGTAGENSGRGDPAKPQNVDGRNFGFGSELFSVTVTAVMPHKSSLPAYAKSLHEKLSNPSEAAAFIRNGIEADVAALIQWDQLRLVPGTFINEDRRHVEADLLFSAPFAENEVFLYLLLDLDVDEDTGVGDRMRVYMERIREMWVQMHGNSRPQPVIMPALVPIFLE